MASSPRVDVFIDGVNFHVATRELAGHAIDIRSFSRMLAAKMGGELGRIHFYIAETPEEGEAREKQRKFFAALAHIPELTLVLGRHKKRDRDGHTFYVEKGTDVNLAADMIGGAYEREFDVAVLVSGDTDQVRTLERTRRAGRKAVWCRCENQVRDLDMLGACSEEVVVSARMLSMCRHRPYRTPQPRSLHRSLEQIDAAEQVPDMPTEEPAAVAPHRPAR